MLTYEEANTQLRYERQTGKIFWKNRKMGGFKNSALVHAENAEAGCYRPPDNRYVIRVNGKLYLRYRLAWLLETGSWPVDKIDHINGDSTDDRFENLRDVDNSTNAENLRVSQSRKTSSKHLGVFRNKPNRTKPWKAAIQVKGKQITLGFFHTEDEAAQAYLSAKRVLHAGCTI